MPLQTIQAREFSRPCALSRRARKLSHQVLDNRLTHSTVATRRRRALTALHGLAVLFLLAIPLRAATLLKTIPVGTNPGQVVVSPSAHLAFVVNQGSNTVSLIDTQQLKVKKILTVGTAPIGIAANPAANKVYVANSGSGTISPISGTSLLTAWTVGGTPSALVVDSVLNQLYVMDAGQNQVEILNASTGAALTTIPTTLKPVAMTINVATHTVFVACSGASGSVVVINGSTRQVVTTVAVAAGTTSISVDPVTNIVVVDSPSKNTHTAINAASGYSVQTQTLSGPFGSAYGDGLFFVSESAGTVVGFADGGTGLFTLGNAYTTNLLGGAGLTINPSSNQMVVLYGGTDTAYLIDLLNPLFTQNYHELTAGSNVAGAAFDPLAGRLFVTSSSGNTVSAFDISPRELVDAYEGNYGGNSINYNFIDANPATGMLYTLRLGNLFAINEAAAGAGDNGTSQNSAGVTAIPLASPYSFCVAVNAATNKVYIGDYADFYVVDGATNTASAITGLPANTQIRDVAVDHATNQIDAWDYFTGNLLVLDGATNAVVKTIPTANAALGPLQVDSSRNLVYLGGQGAFFVIDPAAGTVVTTIPLTGQVLGEALNAPKSRLYVVDNAAKLTVFDTSTNTVVTTISLPYAANSVAVNPFSGNFYAGLNFDVFEYNGSTNKLIKHFTSTAYPAITEAVSLLADPLTDTIYVGTGSGSLSSVLAAIDERTGTVSGVPQLYDNATWALALDLGTGVVGGAGYSYTNLFFPSSSVSGSDVPITVTGKGVVDSLTIASTPIFRTHNTQPSFKITATSSFGVNSTALVPNHLFYQVDGWQGSWKGATLKLQTGTLTSAATIKLPTAVTTGMHILYLYAGVGDVATIQAGLPSGNSVANSPVISPVGAVVFTVEK